MLDEDGTPFTYTTNAERQRVQEALFAEKRTIIENCLFGVDVNPASVSICRLRLWIELLKNAYYTRESGYTQLETLPNIDINIKCGNSLVSKYEVRRGSSIVKSAVDGTKTAAFKKLVREYRDAVAAYKNESNKQTKRAVEASIRDIKKRMNEGAQLDLFDEEYNKRLEAESLFRTSLEWMLEFPEVLDDEGRFTGFDAVIGNPPYVNIKQNQKVSLTAEEGAIDLIRERYPEADEGMINAAKVFYALGFRLMARNGFLCMIIPFGILADTSSVKIRKSVFEKHAFLRIDAFPERDSTSRRVFEDAKMSTAILLSSNEKKTAETSVGVTFEKRIPSSRAEFSVADITAFSPEMMQIPLCNRGNFDLLMKFRTRTDVQKIGDVAPCLTGELDMTQGKKFLTDDCSKPLLVKGVQIARYVFKIKDEEISQGKIEYVDTDEFFKKCTAEKIEQTKHSRIAMQGLSGINEKTRLKAVIVPENLILANSANFLKHQTVYPQKLLLTLFNSRLLNFIFKATSTSSNVNGYEVDALPLPALTAQNTALANEIEALADQILAAKSTDHATDTAELEKQIDRRVYEMYELTPEEIAIVEAK